MPQEAGFPTASGLVAPPAPRDRASFSMAGAFARASRRVGDLPQPGPSSGARPSLDWRAEVCRGAGRRHDRGQERLRRTPCRAGAGGARRVAVVQRRKPLALVPPIPPGAARRDCSRRRRPRRGRPRGRRSRAFEVKAGSAAKDLGSVEQRDLDLRMQGFALAPREQSQSTLALNGRSPQRLEARLALFPGEPLPEDARESRLHEPTMDPVRERRSRSRASSKRAKKELPGRP